MVAYHDTEWGEPLRDEDRLFELLCLEGAQAGLSWSTILNRREGYRAAYDGFDAARIAAYDDDRQAELLPTRASSATGPRCAPSAGTRGPCWPCGAEGPGCGLPVGVRGRDADRQPVARPGRHPGRRRRCLWRSPKALATRGFRFVGPTIVYAYLQSAGLVNDHTVDCFRHPDNAGMPAPD